MTTHDKSKKESFEKSVKQSIPLLPIYLLIPILFWLAFRYTGTDMIWKAFGFGALGWIIALMLRGPISVLGMKLPKERAQKIIVGSSGPLEEGVRLGLLILTGTGFSWALSIGQGWAAVEVVYTIVQVVAIASLAKRTDEKAMQAKAMLEAQGMVSASPFWGLFERVSASAFHIGCTLLVAKYHWLVIALIPLHSFVNLGAVNLAKKSIARLEFYMAIVGIAALGAGLLVY
ncbi:hypothetical protein Back11_03470 [Paenibacillus baekrokdamisoli]|uniref:Uncharacterized protein n=1 Tax=Paenibacillus baekrokdamisoli TaxID=1712516 RepID=A0A3G9ILD2_9BACL|nr:hypothetical protein [Paenibacillus baekrokdamisoli]MBB3072720.1 hypothetical protein [Paenibacillus baekrokdamisoli]BBH19002.1 hypothetical protein Back11_03470 [Paenibacillus baekrokdamisoli]